MEVNLYLLRACVCVDHERAQMCDSFNSTFTSRFPYRGMNGSKSKCMSFRFATLRINYESKQKDDNLLMMCIVI